MNGTNTPQHIFERRICYIFAVSFTRWSVLAYYLRIFPSGLTSLRRLCWILLFLTLCQFIEVLTVLIYFCHTIRHLWTADFHAFSGSQCFSSSAYSYSAAIGDSVLDCLIFALPIPYVWRLSKLRARQRVGLIVIFSLGFIVCAVALLQIPFIRRRADNAKYFGTAINLLVAIQLSLAIVAASLPDIRALIARSFPDFSPLHHRSLNTQKEQKVGGPDMMDEETGMIQRSDQGSRRLSPALEKALRKPDWMRTSLPASLMSTMVTQTELSRPNTRERVLPPLPNRGPIKELPPLSPSEAG
jgi:hypothetical protein